MGARLCPSPATTCIPRKCSRMVTDKTTCSPLRRRRCMMETTSRTRTTLWPGTYWTDTCMIYSLPCLRSAELTTILLTVCLRGAAPTSTTSTSTSSRRLRNLQRCRASQHSGTLLYSSRTSDLSCEICLSGLQDKLEPFRPAFFYLHFGRKDDNESNKTVYI